MVISFRSSLLFLVLVLATAGASAAQRLVDPNYYYHLGVPKLFPKHRLDHLVKGQRINMTTVAPVRKVGGQYWRLTPAPGGTFRLSPFEGDRPQRCLDIHNGGPRDNEPYLRECDNASGQFWVVTPVLVQPRLRVIKPKNARPSSEGLALAPSQPRTPRFSDSLQPIGRFARLTTKFRGPTWCLDVNPNNRRPFLAPCGNYSGQLWYMGPTNTPVAANTGESEPVDPPDRGPGDIGDAGAGQFNPGMGGANTCQERFECEEGYRMTIHNNQCACESDPWYQSSELNRRK